MRRLGAILLLAATPAAAQDVEACLDAVTVAEAAMVEREDYPAIEMTVESDLSWTVAAIRFGYRIAGDGGLVADATNVREIPGGLDPGGAATLIHDVLLPEDAPTDLTVEVRILDVADDQLRPVVGDPEVIGWAADTTPEECEG